MEAHEQNTQKISEGRLEATFFAENAGASTVEGNGHTDCHSARDEEDLLPTQPTPDEVTDREGNAAQSRESSEDRQQLAQGPDDLEAAAPFPQEDVASSAAHSSRLDDAERRRLRYLLGSSLDNPAVLRKIERHLPLNIVAVSRRIAEEAALTDGLQEERARGDMLKALLKAVRAGSGRLESELMAPEEEDQSESAHNLGVLDGANDVGAIRTYLRRGRMSPHPWRSEQASRTVNLLLVAPTARLAPFLSTLIRWRKTKDKSTHTKQSGRHPGKSLLRQ